MMHNIPYEVYCLRVDFVHMNKVSYDADSRKNINVIYFVY